MPDHIPFDAVRTAAAAAGEATRLRLLALLAEAELTVSELVTILGQSQPRAQNVPEAGIYSTGAQWSAITGGAVIGGSGSSPPPYDWVAGASSQKQATSMCSSTYSFSSGPVHLAQYPSGGYDGDYPCGGTL